MRLAPATKVFLYVLTMSGDTSALHDPLWQERYHLDPAKTVQSLRHRGLIEPMPGLVGFGLTTKGQAALSDIADWLWIHEYYLPDVVDFNRVSRRFWQTHLVGYPLLQSLLTQAERRFADDAAYMAVLLRHQLRLEVDTQHNRAAIQTLMALIDQDLNVEQPGDFTYDSSWAKVTQFEKTTLKTLLGRLDWTLSDFEMQFSSWLADQPQGPRLFTRFEVMTIVMYELANNAPKLRQLYAAAAKRWLALGATVQVQADPVAE